MIAEILEADRNPVLKKVVLRTGGTIEILEAVKNFVPEAKVFISSSSEIFGLQSPSVFVLNDSNEMRGTLVLENEVFNCTSGATRTPPLLGSSYSSISVGLNATNAFL